MRDKLAGLLAHGSSGDDGARRIGSAARAPCVALAVSLFLMAASGASASAAQVLDQSQTTGSSALGLGANLADAQIYTAGLSGELTEVDFYITQLGSGASGPINVSIESVAPGGGPDGTPITTVAYDPSQGLGWVSLSITAGVPQVAGTQYAIVLSAPNGGAVGGSSYFALGTDFNAIAGMEAFYGLGSICPSWCANPQVEYEFKTWVTPPPPVTTITLSPASHTGDDGWYTVPVTIGVSATNATETRCALNPLTLPLSFSGLPAGCLSNGETVGLGIFNVYAASTGPGGDETSVKTLTFAVDTIPPTTAIVLTPTNPNPSGWYTGPVNVAIVAYDQASGSGLADTRCQLDGTLPGSFTAMLDSCGFDSPGGANVTTQGAHTIYAASSDNAGNQESVKSASFEIDSVPPTSTITLTPSSPGAGGWYTGPVNVAVNASDSGSGVADTRCQLDGTLPGSFTAIADSCAFSGGGANVTTQGAHTVYAASSDNAGNQESVKSATFKIDSVAPSSTITLTPSTPNGNNDWYTEPVKVSVSASDPTPGSGLASTECELDPASAPLSYAGLSAGCPFAAPGATITSEGDHVVYAASVDNAGNSETPESVSLKIDMTPPHVSFAGTGSYTVNQTVDVTCTATDPAPAVGPGPPSGVAGTPCASPLASGPAYDFAIGLNPVAVTVSDNAGNTAHATNSFTVGVTATSLCTLQGQLIDGSAAYRALPALARKLVDLLAGAGCRGLTPLIARTRAALTLYDALISSETSAGWLTKTQAAMLTKLAADL
jgi:hypothetical protein